MTANEAAISCASDPYAILVTDMNWGQLHVTSSHEKHPDSGGQVRAKIFLHAKIHTQAMSHIDSIFPFVQRSRPQGVSGRALSGLPMDRWYSLHPEAQHNVQHQIIHLPSVARGSILPFIPCS